MTLRQVDEITQHKIVNTSLALLLKLTLLRERLPNSQDRIPSQTVDETCASTRDQHTSLLLQGAAYKCAN